MAGVDMLGPINLNLTEGLLNVSTYSAFSFFNNGGRCLFYGNREMFPTRCVSILLSSQMVQHTPISSQDVPLDQGFI